MAIITNVPGGWTVVGLESVADDRISPPHSAEQAAALNAAFLRDAVASLQAAGSGRKDMSSMSDKVPSH